MERERCSKKPASEETGFEIKDKTLNYNNKNKRFRISAIMLILGIVNDE